MLKQEIGGLVLTFKTIDELQDKARAALPEIRSKRVEKEKEAKALKNQEKALQKFLSETLKSKPETATTRSVDA
jgi:predicted ATP-dependent endonuclease of OLD family